MRVLISSTWGHGHILTMVPLARAFLAAGHEVLWATSDGSCPLVASAGIDAVPAGLTSAAVGEVVGRVRSGPGAAVRPEDKAAFVFPRMFGALATPPMVADLLPIARDWQPQLLVHEHAELAAPLVGALLGVPAVTHAFGGAIPVPILDDAAERLAPLWAEHGLEIPAQAGCFTSAYLDICPPSVQTVPSDHIPVVQPLRPVSWTGEPSASLPDVVTSGDGPLVYVTLGTVQGQARDQVAVLRAVVDSLDDGDPGDGPGPVRVLVTVGPDGDPTALGPVPAHVAVERFVSQAEVLPLAAAVVSHAGSGTVLGALGQGLPQLCLPQAADQFRNSAGVLAAGAGLALHPDDATPERIGAAVRRIRSEAGFATAARAVSDEIGSMPSPAEVVERLVALA